MGGKGDGKKQRQKKVPDSIDDRGPSKKIAKWAKDPPSTAALQPVWLFSTMDFDGPWGRAIITESHAWDHLLPKMRSYESMTWGDIEKDRDYNHSVDVSRLIPEARKRIESLRLDVDELFRLRLSGKQRLWGIRSGERFKILWWDPEHQICPSPKKHT